MSRRQAARRAPRHAGAGPGPRFAAALAIALIAGLAAAPAALAADPTFGPATATAKFGESIQVEQQATLPEGVKRVEALVRAGPNARTFVAEIPAPGAGPTTLRYTNPTPNGALFPNTRVELGFRVTLADGRSFDGPTTTVLYEDDRFTWRSVEGEVVRVHWYEGDDAFGRRALEIGEKAIENATQLLGVVEEDPIDFYIYTQTSDFRDVIGPGLQENVGGLALAPIRTLFANIAPSSVFDPWVSIVVPHELTHIVFDTATANRYHEPTHWLNEGLADYLAIGYDSAARNNVERAVRSNDLMPLRALVAQFPSTPTRFSLAYDESVSAIDFLVRTYGKEKLVALIRSYTEGVSDDAAFSAALGVDTDGFEAAWLADLGMEAPVPFGPLPAPAGSLPPGWAQGAVQTPKPGVTSPATTPRPSDPGDTGDVVGPVLLGILVAFGLVIVAGLFVTVRRLNRGEPFMPPLVQAPPSADEPAADDAAPAPDEQDRP
jgi:hypothetical protein